MILKPEELAKLKKLKTVYTAGSFDLFHCGHVDYLKRIKNDFSKHKLVVGVLSDKRVRSKKGDIRPIMKQRERIMVADSNKYVDYSFICPAEGKDTTFTEIAKFRPEYVVFPQKKYKKLSKKFEELGSKILIQGRGREKVSTTKILERIVGKK